MHPGEVHDGVGFVIAVAKIEAGILSGQLAIYQIVLDVIGERVVGDLVVILAQRSHEAQLVGGIDIENQGSEAAVAVLSVVNDLRNRGLYTEIAAVGVDAGIVSEAFSVAAETESVVGLVEVSGAEDEFGLAVALEAGARDYVEDTVSAVAELGAVAAAIDFEVVDILGIELGAEVGSDVGVGHGDAVDEPTGLVAAADVELVVSEIGAGNVVGDHGETVGAIRAGSLFDIETADQSGGSSGIGGSGFGRARDVHRFFIRGDAQGKMEDGLRSGIHYKVLRGLIESGGHDCDRVFAERNAVEGKLAGGIRIGAGGPLRRLRAQHDHGILYGTVLGIVDDAAD